MRFYSSFWFSAADGKNPVACNVLNALLCARFFLVSSGSWMNAQIMGIGLQPGAIQPSVSTQKQQTVSAVSRPFSGNTSKQISLLPVTNQCGNGVI